MSPSSPHTEIYQTNLPKSERERLSQKNGLADMGSAMSLVSVGDMPQCSDGVPLVPLIGGLAFYSPTNFCPSLIL